MVFDQAFSIENANFSLLRDTVLAFSRRKFCICVLVDLKKAFDTVNQSIHFKKQHNYSIRYCFFYGSVIIVQVACERLF